MIYLTASNLLIMEAGVCVHLPTGKKKIQRPLLTWYELMSQRSPRIDRRDRPNYKEFHDHTLSGDMATKHFVK